MNRLAKLLLVLFYTFTYKLAKQASIYYIHVRKKAKQTAEGPVPTALNVYEWNNPKTDKWYPINAKNIVCFTGFEKTKKLLHWKIIREFFNWLLQGKTVEVQGHYCKETKVLSLDIYDFKLVTEVK